MRNHFLKVAALSSLVLMVGCSDRVGIAQAEMEKIRDGDAQPIEPLPEPKPIESFVYSAGTERSPFVANSLLSLQATQEAQASSVRPDVNRAREPLESYELSQLIYRGKVVAPDGKEYGLVQLPDGTVRDVTVGEYMGKSDGKIVEITPTQINLIEIVPDARVGFVEKKTPLVTPN